MIIKKKNKTKNKKTKKQKTKQNKTKQNKTKKVKLRLSQLCFSTCVPTAKKIFRKLKGLAPTFLARKWLVASAMG